MSVDVSVAALRVADEAFLVSSMIERCPKTMMVRELVVNAIEAASRADADKRVTIMSQLISSVPKLCIRNTGPGLSATELDRICDLASTLHKVSGLDANFGMGAKVASLPSNKHGMRYRSCKNGVVSEVILCQREGVYGRLRRAVGKAGNFAEVVDATPSCSEEAGYDLSLTGPRSSCSAITPPRTQCLILTPAIRRPPRIGYFETCSCGSSDCRRTS